LPSSQPTQSEPLSAQTLAAQTIEARLTENAGGGSQPPVDDGQSPVPPTHDPMPSNTSPPTATLPPTSTPLPTFTATASVPCNRAGFVKDVTVPDGQIFAPGAAFTKTWRLKNTGSCTWDNDYDLVYDSDDKMGGSDVVNLTIGNIAPDDTVDISIDLVAPSASGEYIGNWLLRSGDNEVFGLGNSDVPFYVEIEVAKQASFEILSTNTYTCGIDDYVALRVKNTGTEILESSGGSVKNLSNDAVTNYIFWNTPFTENDDDCPPMNINDIEPGDIYYITANMGGGSSGIQFRFDIKLCTEENGGGDCDTQTKTVEIP
jgi:hypothetical protein